MKKFLCLLAGATSLTWFGMAVADPAGSTYHQIKKIAVGGEGGWDYLTFDGRGHRLYISRSSRVQVVDTEKGAVAGEIANTPGVHGIAIAYRLKRGFTSNGRENTVTIFDTDTLKEVDRVKVGMNPDCIIFDRSSNRVFTFNGGSNDATAIDAMTGKVAGTVTLPGRPEYAVSDGKGEVFCNIEDKSEIVAIDAQGLTVKNTWPIAPGEEASGLAIDRQNRRLFAVCSNEKMVVMDADSGKVVASPTIGKGPDAAAFDPGTGMAYSSNGRDGTLTMIHEDAPDKFSVAATVPTQAGARTMALDQANHQIYLATATMAPPPAGQPAPAPGERRRPNFVPNSFVILVYGP